MGDELHEFKYTEERAEVMRALLELTKQAVRVAELIEGKGYRDDGHKVRNIAQTAASRRSLMAQRFETEDSRTAPD